MIIQSRGSGKTVSTYFAMLEHFHNTKQISDEDYIATAALANVLLCGWDEEKAARWIEEKVKELKQNAGKDIGRE